MFRAAIVAAAMVGGAFAPSPANRDRSFEAHFFRESPALISVRCHPMHGYSACTYVDRGLCHSTVALHGGGMTFPIGGTTWIGHDRVYPHRIVSSQFLDQGGAC